MVGTTISHYKVIEKIGQGGMGEVYRSEDTNLSREVAIKVLPEQFTKDPQRLARFEREAKLLAQLNHPNIAAIYGFEKADGVHFLALELVEGETLAERVAKGPMPVEEALEVCRQIAEGVEAAHEKGVIHRDLKPANIKITPEGQVKILDFGLAKASRMRLLSLKFCGGRYFPSGDAGRSTVGNSLLDMLVSKGYSLAIQIVLVDNFSSVSKRRKQCV